MTWTRTPQEYPDRADVLAVSRSARWLLMEMFSWSNAQLTNGRVPRSILRRISDADDVNADAEELVREGLLEELEEDPGFLFLDWSNQEDADTVRGRAARNVEKTRRARERKERHVSGDHSLCVAPYCKLVTGNDTGNQEVTSPVTKKSRNRELTGSFTPIRSDPIRSVRSKGSREERTAGGSAGATPNAASPGRLHAEKPDVAHNPYGPPPYGVTVESWVKVMRMTEEGVFDGDDADHVDDLLGVDRS